MVSLMQNLSESSLKLLKDEALLEMARDGNLSAFNELICRNQHSCRKIAVSILHDSAEAEDQVQNAFWLAFEHLDQFRGSAQFATWLSRILVNQCLSRLRQIKKMPLLSIEEKFNLEIQRVDQIIEPGPTPEEQLGNKQVAVAIIREIWKIPPILRNVFLLSDVQQLPMSEVAARLGISVSAAKSRLLRSRLELRVRLSRYETRRGLAGLLA